MAQSPGGYPSSTFPAVAVRADGGAVAWLDATFPSQQADLVTADWDGTSIHNTQRAIADPARPRGKNPDGPIFVDPTTITWAGPRTLAMVVWNANREIGLQTQQVTAASIRGGWMKGAVTVRPHDAGFAFFDRVTSADTNIAYAVERSDGDPTLWKTRAVSVDLATGNVVEVVALPATGREVTDVSGGSSGIVYTTAHVANEGDEATRFYVRFPGETHGSPIVGLPIGADSLQAQS